MKRRELFATLGAIVGAAIGSKVVANDAHVSIKGKFVGNIPPMRVSDFTGKDEFIKIHTSNGNGWIWSDDPTPNVSYPRNILLNGRWVIPIADIANRPEDAQRIFQFVANTSCEYAGVAYFELTEPTVIISGNCGTSKSSVLLTPTSVKYRTITNQGRELIHDAKTQKVIDFIRTLGYDFQ